MMVDCGACGVSRESNGDNDCCCGGGISMMASEPQGERRGSVNLGLLL